MSDSVGEPPGSGKGTFNKTSTTTTTNLPLGSGKGSSNKTTTTNNDEEENGGDVANKSPPPTKNNTNNASPPPPPSSPLPPPPTPSRPLSSKNNSYTDSKVKKNSPPVAKSADSTTSEPPATAPTPTNKSSPTPSPGSQSTIPSPPPPKISPGNKAGGSVPVPPPSDDPPPSPPPPKPDPSPPPPKSNPSPSPPPKSSSPSPSPPPPPTPTAGNPPTDDSSEEAPSKSAPPTSNDSPTPPSSPPSQTMPTPSGSKVPPSSVPPPPGQANSAVSSSPTAPTGDPSSPLSPSPPGKPIINFPPFPNIPFPPPPASRKPHLSPASHESKTNSTDRDQPSLSATNIAIIAGASIAGLLIIALVAFFILNTKKKKKKNAQTFPAPQGPLPGNFPMQPDGYYYMKQHPQNQIAGLSDQSDEYKKGKNPATGIGPNQGTYRAMAPEPGGLGGAKLSFSYEELMNITNMFSPENVIGEGGFGCVYKGWLQDGRIVAVKELRDGSGQGEREFRAEVEIISRVHHRHLVSLVGYCIAESHRLLVYEFVPNSNLSHHLHGQGLPVLEWPKRVKIAIGAARGLKYLHDDCHPKIIHRDIKSANILLDETYEAQVADFGLAKLRTDSNTHISTRVMGTFGYMAPEYATSGKLTDKSDVFSFGVVLLELVTGRKPVDPTQPLGDESLVEWARPLLINALDTGEFSELADPRLQKRYVEIEMYKMIEAAAACIRHSAQKRPRMVQVLTSLDNESHSPDLTNGVKLGHSTAYESGRYSKDFERLQRMAFADSSEYEMSSGEYTSRELRYTPPSSLRPEESNSAELLVSDTESCTQGSEKNTNNARANYRSHQFSRSRYL